MATYPEHEKLAQIRDKSQIVGEFLDWLSQQGYYICRWQDAGNNGQPRYIPATAEDIARIHEEEGSWKSFRAKQRGIENPEYESWYDGFYPTGRRIDEYLADFFSIDQNKLEDEKRAMLDVLRASYAEQDAPSPPVLNR